MIKELSNEAKQLLRQLIAMDQGDCSVNLCCLVGRIEKLTPEEKELLNRLRQEALHAYQSRGRRSL